MGWLITPGLSLPEADKHTRYGHSTQPSTLHGTAKCVWLSNNPNGDRCTSGLREPTGGLKGQVCCLACELAATWCQPTFIQVTHVNSRNGFVIHELLLLLLRLNTDQIKILSVCVSGMWILVFVAKSLSEASQIDYLPLPFLLQNYCSCFSL